MAGVLRSIHLHASTAFAIDTRPPSRACGLKGCQQFTNCAEDTVGRALSWILTPD